MLIQEPVHAAIWHCLNHYAYGDATFLAERLFTEVHSDESLHLLATCYYRSGKLGQAYDILKKNSVKTPQNRFLMAKCSADLCKTHEAEVMLVGDVLESKPKDVFDEVINNFEDAACFALQILARIYSSTERAAKANEADRRALKLNPLLWKSFEGLCQRGDYPDPSKVFATDKLDCLSQCQGLNPILSYVNKASSPPSANYAASSLPQPRVSLLATPTYSYGGASTSTPILPVSSLHVLSNGPQQAMSQSIMMVTPVHQSVANSIEESGCDSVFSSASPVPESFRCFAISGVGALDLSSDLDQSNITAPFFESQQKMMPPPPIKPKPTRRIAPSAMAQNDSRNMTPPTTEFRGGTNDRSFGRLPRGALVWSSNGKSEQTGVNPNLQGARLDFSPLTALSPFSPNPSTPVQQSAVGSSVAGDQSSSSAVPLINTTNNDTKIKRSQIENSSPLKQAPFGQTVQNTPSNNSGSGSVRRSSRLGSSQQLSIKSKENTKTPSTPTVSSKTSRAMKSPSKKTSKATRLNSKTGPNQASTDASSQLAEKNEKNKLLDLDVENIPRITLQNPEVSAIVTDQALSLQKQSMDGLMFLMRQLGAAYVDLSRFASRKAIAQLENLAPHHRNTGWVKGIMGMAYFEMGDYRETKKLFQSMRDLDPYRTEFMEYFSTTLWHLQEEVDLSALAQELTAFDKMSPQAWCAAGNCFSLQKEHENAIKFFQRAAQVNPSFAYAYTLLGHEYITIEELDKALSCFRTAVRIDPRHYNAWYGIGLVFYKQERFQLAEIYYRKAVEINPQSPVLMCHVAVVQHALQRTEKALETLNVALKAAPKNPLCKFERASILFSSERYDEALGELNDLKVLVPKESPVYFLMGKVHNKLNNTHLALMHFSWAMDLDPKGANSQIKDALDRSMNRAAQEDAEVVSHLEARADVPIQDDDNYDEDDEMMHDGSDSRIAVDGDPLVSFNPDESASADAQQDAMHESNSSA